MSTPLNFAVLSGRRVPIRADLQSSSWLKVKLALRRSGPIVRPVDVASALKSFGLGLAAAHVALNRIVADEVVELTLGNADRATIIPRLAELAIDAR